MVRHRLPLGACLYRLMCYFNRCDMETKTTNTLQPLNLSSILDTCLICTSSCRPRRCRFGLPWGLRAWGPVRVCCGVSRRLCVGGWAASLGGAVLLVGVLLRRPGAGGGPWRGGWGLSGRGARRVLFRCCFSFHCILRVNRLWGVAGGGVGLDRLASAAPPSCGSALRLCRGCLGNFVTGGVVQFGAFPLRVCLGGSGTSV